MRTLKTYALIALTGLMMTFSFSAFAKKNAKAKLTYGQTIALSSANLINRYKTVGQFIKIFKPHMNAKQFRDFKKVITSHDISLKDKLPRVKAQGSKILVGQAGYIDIKDSETFAINGQMFKGSDENISERFETIYSKIAPKKKSKVSMMNLIVPEAHAFGNMLGALAILGAGMGGYHYGPKLLGVGGLTGALLGVGGVYLATELWQTFKSGDVTCSKDGKYQQRSKARNSWFMAMEEQTVISSDKVAEAGLSENCTDNNAAALKAWGEQDRLRIPAATTPVETAAPSSAIYGE